MRVTMKDVADVMGVSVMTVSNAFNRPDQLSVDLRDRILVRAQKMGYGAPNAAARNLRQGRTNCYGVVFSESLNYAFSDPYSVLWLSGLSQSLEQAGKTMMLLPVSQPSPANLDLVRRASVDGIAGLCASGPVLEVAKQTGLPVVTTALAGADGSWVAIDDHAAGRQVGRHVRRLGHRDVALVVEQVMPIHDADPIEQSLADYRVKLDDYRHQGLYDLWIRVDGLISGLGDQLDLRVVSAGLNSRRSGRLAAELLLDQLARPTAIVCVSDVLAFGVLDAMHDRGLVPGRDVTVIGFDDLPEAERQGLTTVHQPIHDKGRLVGELLLDPAQGPRQVTLPHTLMVRATSAPPRSN